MLRNRYLCKTIYRLWPDYVFTNFTLTSCDMVNYFFTCFSKYSVTLLQIIFTIVVPDITSPTGFWEISSQQNPRKLDNNQVFEELLTDTYYMEPDRFLCSSSLKKTTKIIQMLHCWNDVEIQRKHRNVNCSCNLKPIPLPKIPNQTANTHCVLIVIAECSCYHRMKKKDRYWLCVSAALAEFAKGQTTAQQGDAEYWLLCVGWRLYRKLGNTDFYEFLDDTGYKLYDYFTL